LLICLFGEKMLSDKQIIKKRINRKDILTLQKTIPQKEFPYEI